MRKLIYAINVTLDGCCDHTQVVPDEGLMEYYTQLVRAAGAFVYGRVTYQLMIPYWPDIAKNRPESETQADIDFAQAFDAVGQIVVFSRTLDQAAGKHTRIVRTGLRDEILKLKQEPGKDILVGGVDIPSQLMALDLIDEYRFVVQPVIAGEGRRLAPRPQERLRLKLVESKTFKGGSVALRYLRQT
ncbi:MAG TPA: dihydrofolate reductase family protein [Gammaproteobacteria bacterium]|jgi:dihydrofolate reductase